MISVLFNLYFFQRNAIIQFKVPDILHHFGLAINISDHVAFANCFDDDQLNGTLSSLSKVKERIGFNIALKY
jgi:hypothetical protein